MGKTWSYPRGATVGNTFLYIPGISIFAEEMASGDTLNSISIDNRHPQVALFPEYLLQKDDYKLKQAKEMMAIRKSVAAGK